MRRQIPAWYRVALIVVVVGLTVFALGNHLTRDINAYYHPSDPNLSRCWVWSPALVALLLVGEAIWGWCFSTRYRNASDASSTPSDPTAE